MRNIQLNLSVLEDSFSVCQLAPDAGIPHWAPTKGLVSITRTADELSIVCLDGVVPDTVRAERGFRVLKIEGPFDFSLTGILLAVIGPLSDVGISIFAVSTFDTDYVLVKKNDLKQAVSVLSAFGHTVR
ncbi:ACT domain-containing protein [uncultured Desulfosarcina sp.]|uniref:ACT domain-containing protein n=1 Tax=uncultured Desulfosarcina sp. TaxID=218289 RepID=UPI0029C8BBDD|nr:ACT domain-containing protein [uncultured Desulfosarcina sp.]